MANTFINTNDIRNLAITNAKLAGSIAYSKLSLTGAILNTDLAGSIASSKLVSTDIVTVGALTAGSIGSGFGNINIGSSTITAGALVVSTITATIASATTANVVYYNTGTGVFTYGAAPVGSITGSGTIGKITKWTSASAIGDSILTESGNVLTNSGALGTNTVVNGLELINTTAATNTTTFGYSPALYMQATSWHTASGGGSNNSAGRIYMKGTSFSSASFTGKMVFEVNSNGGTFSEFMNAVYADGLYITANNLYVSGPIKSSYTLGPSFQATTGTDYKYITFVAAAGECIFGAENAGGNNIWSTAPANYAVIRANNGLAICTSGPSGTTQFSMDTTGNVVLSGSLTAGAIAGTTINASGIITSTNSNNVQVIGNSGATTGYILGQYTNTSGDIVWGVNNSSGTLISGGIAYSGIIETATNNALQFATHGILALTIASNQAITAASSVTATSFIKSGGSPAQYLMADGSITTGGGLGTSGTYTPTATAVSGTSGLTIQQAQYIRVGNIVTVSGYVTGTCTASSNNEVRLSLPVASNFSSIYQCAGTAVTTQSGAPNFSSPVLADVTNDQATLQWASPAVTAFAFFYTYTYEII